MTEIFLRMETYSVCDDCGQLRYVLPPEASRQLGAAVSAAVLDAFAYRYAYDRYGRMTEKQLPGCAPVYMVYDAGDRLALSQDGNQRAAGKWSYCLYDSRNRPVEIGEVPLAGSRETLQQLVGATSAFHPGGGTAALQQLHYDNYDLSAALSFLPVSGYAASCHTLVAGLLTCCRTRIPDTDTWITTACYYDSRSRIIQTAGNNPGGGVSRVCTAYDFTGNPLKVRESHSGGDGREDVLETVCTYDSRCRLLSRTCTLNGNATASVVCGYDAIGRLSSKTYGFGAGQTTETMTYNIRDWLTGKSNGKFDMKLRYQNPVTSAPARYNGGIAEWEWQQNGFPTALYAFIYDGASRLTDAVYHTQNGAAWTPSDAFSERIFGYDLNGNITSLSRCAPGTAPVQLSYAYSGNRLSSLGGSLTGSYSYDANGNLINDSRKNLNITYNFLNLLESANNGAIRYTWLADGTKLGAGNGDGTECFDYLGSLIYKRDASGRHLECALFGDGRILPDAGGSPGYAEYFLTDHLGSVRAVVDGRDGSVKERSDYYPFGSRHPRPDYQQSSGRFLFNGKELQTTGGLGFLDYGARMLDPEVGRWFGMDPLAESNYSLSSYNFCGNNPVLMLDPDGMDYWSTNDPSEISRFLGALSFAGKNKLETFDYGSWDLTKWNHVGDSEFLGNLTYNDVTRTFYSSYGKVIGGVATSVGVRVLADFVADNTATLLRPPLSFSDIYGKQDFSGYWGGLKYYWTGGDIDGIKYNREGGALGFSPNTGTAPTPGKINLKGVKSIRTFN